MSRQLKIDDATGAFELLLEQLEEVKAQAKDHMVSAVHMDDYDELNGWTKKRKGVDKIIREIKALLDQMKSMFDLPSDPEPCPPLPSKEIRLVLQNKNCDARATYYDRKYVTVRKGSSLAKEECKSLSPKLRGLRKKLMRSGQLRPDSSGLMLTLNEDYRFNSLSAAACFVVGYSTTGKNAWIEDSHFHPDPGRC